MPSCSGVLEGLTEFLPRLVHRSSHPARRVARSPERGGEDARYQVIQLGAVLAVVVYFRERLDHRARHGPAGSGQPPPRARPRVRVSPAAVVGLLFHKAIKAHLFGPGPVAAALIVGGFPDDRRRVGPPPPAGSGRPARRGRHAPARARDRLRAVLLALARRVALDDHHRRRASSPASAPPRPPSSRSSSPSPRSAPRRSSISSRTAAPCSTPRRDRGRSLVELAVSFAVALLVIAVFLRYLKRYGLAPFGWYRVALGALVLWLWVASCSPRRGRRRRRPHPRREGDVAAAADGLARTAAITRRRPSRTASGPSSRQGSPALPTPARHDGQGPRRRRPAASGGRRRWRGEASSGPRGAGAPRARGARWAGATPTVASTTDGPLANDGASGWMLLLTNVPGPRYDAFLFSS